MRHRIMTDVVDNPCWGGAERRQHDLPFLLRLITAATSSAAVDDVRRDDSYGDGSTADEGEQDEAESAERRPQTRRRSDTRLPPLILHESGSYVVLNKPPDLRMDGPHPSTVHKLLSFWYPSPSLIQRAAAMEKEEEDRAAKGKDVSEDDRDDDDETSALMQVVSSLSKFNDVLDNSLRPAHQLDYATSGVLLVARSREAAATACRAFHERQTEKEYIAILDGHLDTGGYPVLAREALREWDDGTAEGSYRRGKKNRGRSTFVGYLPGHSVFDKWKRHWSRWWRRRESESADVGQRDIIEKGMGTNGDEKQHLVIEKEDRRGIAEHPPQKKKKEIPGQEESARRITMSRNGVDKRSGSFEERHCRSLSPRRKASSRDDCEVLASLTPCDLIGRKIDEDNLMQRILDMKWSDVKKNAEWKRAFVNLTAKYNSAQKPRAEASSSEEAAPSLPPLFRIEGEDERVFYVHAAIAEESPTAFRMTVHPNALKGHPHRRHYESFVPRQGESANDGLDYKPALTRCVVLWKGTLAGSDAVPVTKVRLQPKTGRRHQLRLHMVVCRNPILGDATYKAPNSLASVVNDATSLRQGKGEVGSTGSTEMSKQALAASVKLARIGGRVSRMCLHAHRLSLPLFACQKNGRSDEVRGTEVGETQTFVAPDPFRIVQAGDGSRERLIVVDSVAG